MKLVLSGSWDNFSNKINCIQLSISLNYIRFISSGTFTLSYTVSVTVPVQRLCVIILHIGWLTMSADWSRINRTVDGQSRISLTRFKNEKQPFRQLLKTNKK